MSNRNTYDYLSRYLDQLRGRGRYTFTGQEVQAEFNLTNEACQKVIQRLLEKKRISRLRQNFYLIIPPEFAARQTLPLSYFVDALMKFLDREYYVGLLTAAMYHGAAHQQPQTQFVVTQPPYLRPIKNLRQSILFCIKKKWSGEDIIQSKTDAGYIHVSSPALTALDLVSYSDRIGGYSRAATVLTELVNQLDPVQLKETAGRYTQTTTLQRFGYLLDIIQSESAVSDAVSEALEMRNFYPVKLNPKMNAKNQKTPNRWKVIPNMTVEVDEL